MVWDRDHQVPDSDPAHPQEVIEVLNGAFDRDLDVVEVGWLSRFHSEERQVPRYRHGRVFLAGDAAHIHSPMGGQGMNTGIQDANNLAWKVDAVLGGANPEILDSYHAERHPIGRRVVRQSGLMARSVTLKSWPARTMRDLVGSRLLARARIRDMIAGSFAGTELRYRPGRGQHPLVGTNANLIALTRRHLSDLQRTPAFVLVRESGVAPLDLPAVPQLLQAERADPGPAVLVRPDGYVTWAGESTDSGWKAALQYWTGHRLSSVGPELTQLQFLAHRASGRQQSRQHPQ